MDQRKPQEKPAMAQTALAAVDYCGEHDHELLFFAEKFDVPPKADRRLWVWELMQSLHLWWLVPKNEPYITQCDDAARLAAERYLRSRELPGFFAQATSFAQKSPFAF